MWKCPVCDQENNAATVCPTCGYDRTCDYEQYPTAFAVTTATPTHILRRRWQEKQNPPVNGRNRKRTVTVTQEQAAQGCRVTAGYVDGQRLEITVPAGTKDGSVLRCRGLGQPGSNGGRNGDLLVTVRVQEPEPAPQPAQSLEKITTCVNLKPGEAAQGCTKSISFKHNGKKVSMTLSIPAGVVYGEKLHYPRVRADDGILYDVTAVVEVQAPPNSFVSLAYLALVVTALPAFVALLTCLYDGFSFSTGLAWVIASVVSSIVVSFIVVMIDCSVNKKKYGPKTPEEKERCQTPREMPPQR